MHMLEGEIQETDVFNKIKEFQKNNMLQLFDLDSISSKYFIEYAVYIAKKRFDKGVNIANNLSTEILLVVGQTPHVQKAISSVGIKNPKRVLLISDFDNKELDGILKELKFKKHKIFDKQTKKQEIYTEEEMAIENSAINLM
ncbi:hypothetical protein KO465_05565 [Candidatus Micrarchaeota archaeon]|nr:hypothetical protein [Candidatus Micrarchaeota archaeon]